MQKVSDDAYDEFCACTTENRTVLCRGYLFARSNIRGPRNLYLQVTIFVNERLKYDLLGVHEVVGFHLSRKITDLFLTGLKYHTRDNLSNFSYSCLFSRFSY